MTDMENPMSNDTVGNDGIFLRAADRARFDYLMRAIRDDSASVALSSDNDGVLDHYGRLVLAKLRKTDGLQIEVFLPQNTEALLERYNQILAGLSIEDARKASGSPAPRRVLLAHDAKALSTRDLQLLARLVQDFPGANVSLVLLVDKAGTKLHERTLEGFGQRLLRWPVEAPTRSEGDALLKVARAMGFEVEAKKVLAATGYAEIKIAQKKDKTKAEPDAAQVRFEQQLAAARKERDELDALEQQVQEKARPQESLGRTEPSLDGPAPTGKLFTPAAAKGRSLLNTAARWVAALALLLAVSIGVIVALFPQRMSPLLANSPILKETLPPWAMNMVVSVVGKPPAAVLEESKAEAAKATVPAAGADLPKDDMASAPAPAAAGPDAAAGAATATNAATTAANGAAPAAATAAAPATPAPAAAAAAPVDAKGQPAKADAGKAAPTKGEPATAEPAKVDAKNDVKPDVKPDVKADAKADAKTDPKADAKADPKADPKTAAAKPASAADALAPRSETGVDAAVRAAKTGSFYVQHVSLGTMAEAQEWRAQFRALSGAKIVAVNTQDKGIKFAVISGPFADRKQAEAFAAKSGVPADPWLRPVKSLQGALLGSSR